MRYLQTWQLEKLHRIVVNCVVDNALNIWTSGKRHGVTMYAMEEKCRPLKDHMKRISRSGYVDLSLYVFLFVATVFINKYVLSVLMFTYPTIFQGWQTLIGFLILKCLTWKEKYKVEVTPLDRTAAFSLLPHFIFFVGAIVAGSKALAVLPIPVFLSICNLLPASIFLLDHSINFHAAGIFRSIAAILCLGTAICVILLDINMTLSDYPYFWMLVHIVLMTVQSLHSRIADSRYGEMDKLYYSYIFSVVVLAPGSLYLEEAFLVLHFQHRRQIRFYIGCLLSGILGAFLNVWTCRIRLDKRFGKVQGIAKALTCLLAVPTFQPQLSTIVWASIAVNVVSSIFVPSDTTEDEADVLDV